MLRFLMLFALTLPAFADAPKPGKIQLPGGVLDYETTCDLMPLKDDDGKVTANVFYIAYTKKSDTPRPLTFCFNGGPGSSSVWLHLGAFGPKRVALTDTGDALPPPAKLVDNESTILDLTDLVFIDPVSTGYSRAAEEKNAKNFHGVTEDVQSVAEFIRLYVTKNDRWGSPKYLAGESYGTTRAAGLSGHLQSRMGMRLNGIVLVSAVLNFGTLRFDDGNDQPYPLFLPSYTATAWYHKKLDASLMGDFKRTLAEAEHFAANDYTLALQKGLSLNDTERKIISAKLAKYTGLSPEFILRCDLRVEGQRFMRELLRDKNLIVGRYDSRYTANDGNPAAERPDFDPSYAAVQGTFTEGFNRYVRGDLGYKNDMQYEILTGKVQPWNFGNSSKYLNTAPTLRQAMATNPDLKVFVANGYYDLATPYAATQYTMNHLGSEKKLLDRVTMAYYDAGHMMYALKPAREKLKKDLEAFYK